MSLLQHHMDQGNITIGGQHQLLHDLFADDTGIFLHTNEANFHKIREVITDYECVSEVLLNLEKSTLLQLNDSPHHGLRPQAAT